MKYFSFKRLNKIRRINFIIFLISSIFLFIIGILNLNFWQLLFAILVFIECLDIFNEQSNDDIIKKYENILSSMLNSYNELLSTLNKSIKIKGEEINDSNK